MQNFLAFIDIHNYSVTEIVLFYGKHDNYYQGGFKISPANVHYLLAPLQCKLLRPD